MAEGPIRILLLVSSPLDALINIEADLAHIEDALRPLPVAAEVHVRIAEATDLQDHLSRGDTPRYDIVHYLGHGLQVEASRAGSLVFETPTGRTELLDGPTLGMALAGLKPTCRLAVVSACHSERVAAAMHGVGIPHVVAIEGDESVYERTAIVFSGQFYRGILTGRGVKPAFDAARDAVGIDRELTPAKRIAEAAKFKLLSRPDAVSADNTRLAAPTGSVSWVGLPGIEHIPFEERPKGFVGRERDLLRVRAQLERTAGICIKGPSGVGKTELAKELAHWLVARRQCEPSRVHFVALGAIRAAGDARQAIAAVLGLKRDDVGTNSDLARQVPYGTLLVLDEAEELVHTDGFALRTLIEAIVGARARPRVIVTSQTDVGASGAPVVEIRRLADSAAFHLFARHANLSATDAQRLDRMMLRKVLDEVGGIPRAIALVARAWRGSTAAAPDALDLGLLVADLERDHDQIMRDPQYPDDVKGVTVGIRYAYDRLRMRSHDAARVFTRLALFPGGISAAGLDAILGDGATACARLILDQSLAEVLFGRLPVPMNDLIVLPAPFRSFAARELGAGMDQTRNEIGPAVLKYYLSFEAKPHQGWINKLDAGIRGGDRLMAAFIARYDAEWPTIVSWLEWGLQRGQCEEKRSRPGRLAAELESYFVVTDRLRESRNLLNRALSASIQCLDELGEANVRQALGNVLVREDDLKGARAAYEAALGIYVATGARLGEANVQKALGDLLVREEDLKGARAAYETALGIYAAISARLGEANTRRALGDVLVREADLKGARAEFAAALGIYPAIGDRLGEANARKAFGDLLARESEVEGARVAYEAALGIYAAIGHRLGEANVRNALGDLLIRESDVKGARAAYEAARDLYIAIGHRLGEANVRQALGDVLLREADLSGARAAYEAALRIYVAIGDRLGGANAYRSLGTLALTEGEYENARHELLRARALHEQLGSRIGLAGDLTILGRVADAVKDFASAVDLFEQSLLIDRAIGAQFDEALNLDDQADALTALEEHDAAIAAWWLERQIHERIADQAAVARLDEILGQIHDQIEPAEWSALEAALASDAEGIRRAGVARVVAQNADGRPQTADG